MTLARALMWISALGLLVAAVGLWPHLPDRIPVHFGLDGEPDQWAERFLLAWLTLPLVGVALAVVLEAVATWAVRHPDRQTVNVLSQRALMELPVERRVPVLERVASMLYWTGAVSLVALAAIQVGTWEAATGEDGPGWVLAGTLGVAAGSLGILVWGLARIEGEIKRQREATLEADE
ncbi:DUF1648 domain-containing protein [Rubrivirga sp.]|uniref:DUF1648 domain-containing protein n=1 Tax=Rubrivirga sp. TaxID=1885344 RepID=UPI003C7793F9